MANQENLTEPVIQERLDETLKSVIYSMKDGRDTIYEISEECHQQVILVRASQEEVTALTSQVIKAVDEYERREQKARRRLTQISQKFYAYSEAEIRQAFEEVRQTHTTLTRLRQQESFLRKRRDELDMQLRKFEKIASQADNYLESTNLALKILEGNIDKLTDSLKEAQKKQQIGLWIVETMEAERRKMARELHDGPAQTLAGMMIRMDLIDVLCREDVAEAQQELGSVRQMAHDALDEVRRVMFDLKPNIIDESGLLVALQDYFDDYESKYNFEIEMVHFGSIPQLDLSLETALFRLVQESITNARKHSGTKQVLVKIECTDERLCLVIKDEGCGFDEVQVRETKKDSYGIIGMKERAELLGGNIEVLSAPGEGTQVIIEVPTEGEENSGG